MIFAVEGHIDMIRNGLCFLPADNLNSPAELRIIKTQTRRLNRGIYKVGKDYAVQRKRGVKAEPDIRIVMDAIWEEIIAEFHREDSTVYLIPISKENAWSEGGYTPLEYEEVSRKLNPKWNRFRRWAFEFHVIHSDKVKYIHNLEYQRDFLGCHHCDIDRLNVARTELVKRWQV